MNELQQRIYSILCNLTGEEVTNLFTNYYGNQLLDDEDFMKFLDDEGYEEIAKFRHEEI